MITGGVKSGKSEFALRLADKYFNDKYFLATAEAFDDEIRKKIEKHKKDRPESFITIEEPIHIEKFIRNDLLLDCITLWLNNLFHYNIVDKWEEILDDFLKQSKDRLIIVTNETGMGNIPPDRASREYNNILGAANKKIAERMDLVYLMISGLPLKIKG